MQCRRVVTILLYFGRHYNSYDTLPLKNGKI